jgi:hypothetical protein
MAEQAYIPQCPTHVVVDTIDGYVFKGDSLGDLFNQERATAFAAVRNAELKPEFQSYKVFALVAPSSVDKLVDWHDNLTAAISQAEQAKDAI